MTTLTTTLALHVLAPLRQRPAHRCTLHPGSNPLAPHNTAAPHPSRHQLHRPAALSHLRHTPTRRAFPIRAASPPLKNTYNPCRPGSVQQKAFTARSGAMKASYCCAGLE